MKNIILATDSYKLTHWNQYPHDTEAVYSYFESRPGAEWPYTVFFGLQSILKQIEGRVVTGSKIAAADKLSRAHFGRDLFNRGGWRHVSRDHKGYLPLRIKAVPEGMVIPTGNVMMTVENTCPECYWLTNAVESLLTHVWYPSTVATLSRTTKEIISDELGMTAETKDGLPFMLHDFGYRGASSHESAAIGGAAHLVNFVGTDTLPAMELLLDEYGADADDLAFSVPATEHSVMTARGREAEMDVVEQLLDEYPTGILSVVADSYDIYEFVNQLGTRFRDKILTRDGKFVVRPDSTTHKDKTPALLVRTLLDALWDAFGGHTNRKGYRVFNPHIGLIWGDGIDPHGIKDILITARLHGYSAENLVFGMGGGLLQKVNRDTQRFAFKMSAIKRGAWHEACKDPLDASKASKKGRLMLAFDHTGMRTLTEGQWHQDLLQTMFENGEITTTSTLAEIRIRAALAAPGMVPVAA